MKKIITMAMLATCLMSSAAFAYVGNSNSYKFHIEGCRAEQKIRADHRVYFENTRRSYKRRLYTVWYLPSIGALA